MGDIGRDAGSDLMRKGYGGLKGHAAQTTRGISLQTHERGPNRSKHKMTARWNLKQWKSRGLGPIQWTR